MITYETQEEAEVRAKNLGAGYRVLRHIVAGHYIVKHFTLWFRHSETYRHEYVWIM